MSGHTGIPLLSGPPPPHPGPAQSACTKCGREFNILFHRQRKCMHCGHGFCSSCTDYQALMPRRGSARGYDLAPVCAFCIEMLNVTAHSRAQLRSLPLAKLRRYISAYNIPVKNPIDKNDLVDAAMAARTPQGCLSPVNEDYYRKHSVPPSYTPGSSSSSANRNSSARGFPNANANSGARSSRPFARPDLDPNRRQRPPETEYSTYTPRSATNTQRSRTTSTPMNPEATRPTGGQNIPRPTSSSGQQSTPRTTNTAHPSPSSHMRSASPLPPPPMSTLVTLPRSSLSALSVGTLKQILWEARVRVPPGIVEKEELVERVWALVEEEKRKDDEGLDDDSFELDADEVERTEEPDREEEAVLEMVDPEWRAHPGVAHEHGQGNNHHHATTEGFRHDRVEGDSETTHEYHSVPAMDSGQSTSTPQPSTFSLRPSTSPSHPEPTFNSYSHPKSTSAERSGLCVICQDDEANIAVVDCGHLAMCRACSDLVLASSRECPLCRTRIVTEARLLRIFKT